MSSLYFWPPQSVRHRNLPNRRRFIDSSRPMFAKWTQIINAAHLLILSSDYRGHVIILYMGWWSTDKVPAILRLPPSKSFTPAKNSFENGKRQICANDTCAAHMLIFLPDGLRVSDGKIPRLRWDNSVGLSDMWHWASSVLIFSRFPPNRKIQQKLLSFGDKTQIRV